MSTDKNPDKDNLPKQISPELLQMLANMQAKAQAGQPARSQPKRSAATRRQELIMKTAQYIGVKLQNGVHNIDRFLNFVVKPTDPDRNDVVQTARSPIIFGTYVIIIFFVFGGLWSALAPLDSASHAMGTVISSSKIQKLQFLDNGIISAIYVKPGDHVKIGDPLVAVDKTRYQTDYDAALNQYRTYLAMEARLIAERDGEKEITFPELLLKDATTPEVIKIIHTQENLFKSKCEVLAAHIEQLNKRLTSYKSAEDAHGKASKGQVERARAARDLFAKGFLSKKDLYEIETREGGFKSQLAETEGKIAETEIELNNIKSKNMAETLRELRETQTGLTEIRERYNKIKDLLDHSVLTSPVDGVVNFVHVNTIGGVVGSGHPVVEVSPVNDTLVIEARIAPTEISSVHVGLKAKIRFTAFKSRTSPMFNGKVVALSADVVQDQSQGMQGQGPYYAARIEIDMDEFNYEAKLRGLALHPGMQVDVQIVTGTRTLLRYLLDPITDVTFKAFKEK